MNGWEKYLKKKRRCASTVRKLDRDRIYQAKTLKELIVRVSPESKRRG